MIHDARREHRRSSCTECAQSQILFSERSDQARLVDQHNYNTRHRHNFQLQAHRLSLYEKKPSYRGAAFFNRLPKDLQKLQDKQCKKALA
ncbi:hypothetical protein J6590_019789 [Homalodisca vitripennis]|nr:hypothetical protein J6590_019789 [Homalodisca vitripennis]